MPGSPDLRRHGPHDRGALLGLGAHDALGYLTSLGAVRRPARLLKDAVLARYLWSLGGPRLLAAYFDPVFRGAGRIDPGAPPPAVQQTDPRPPDQRLRPRPTTQGRTEPGRSLVEYPPAAALAKPVRATAGTVGPEHTYPGGSIRSTRTRHACGPRSR